MRRPVKPPATGASVSGGLGQPWLTKRRDMTGIGIGGSD